VISLQHGFGVTASQTPVAVTLAESPDLLDGKTARTGMYRGSSLAAVVGLGLLDLLGVVLSPLLAAGDYFFAVTLVVSLIVSYYDLLIVRCPLLLVFGYLFLVLFLVLSARLDSMGQVRPGFLVLGVLL
jgi:hypothetical protein